MIFFLSIYILFPFAFINTNAEGQEISVDDLINEIDWSELNEYLNKISEFEYQDAKEGVLSLLTGEGNLNYTDLFSSISNLFFGELKNLIPFLLTILVVSLVCGVAKNLKISNLQSSMSDIIDFVGYISIGSLFIVELIKVIGAVQDTIFGLNQQMHAIYPILLTFMAGSGGVSSVAIFRPAVAFLSEGFCSFFQNLVLPLTVALIIFHFVSNLSDVVRMQKVCELIKSFLRWSIGLSIGIFSLYLSIQGMTSGQYDGISLRTAKYLISGSVPYLGGFISGSSELIIAGSVLLKNALGTFSVFLLSFTLIKPLILLVSFGLFLKLAAVVLESSGSKLCTFFSDVSSDNGFFVAILVGFAFVYFLTVVLMVCMSGSFL